MSADVEYKLCNILKNTEFSLHLDESTLPGNESLLLGYVRFVHNGVICEELAIALSLNADTRGETVFQEVKTYFETNAIPLNNVIAWATRRHHRLVRHPNSIRASTNQGQGRGSILLPHRAATLPRFDAGSDGVKPTSSCVIQNPQTSCSSWYMM